MTRLYEFTYDLMFCEVLNRDPEIAKEIIERILNTKISNITSIEPQKTENYSINSRGVRFDVFLKDEKNTHYDVEIQTSRFSDLPKRMRYYQSANDSTYIKRGEDYSSLPESYIIFICTYDPFGRNRAFYSFGTVCQSDPQMSYNEGAYKIVLNSKGNRDNISKELSDFLSYIETEKPNDELSLSIDNMVSEINSDENWRHQTMTLEDKLREQKKQGIEIGRKEGFEIGRTDTLLNVYRNIFNSYPSKDEALEVFRKATGLSDEEIGNIINHKEISEG